HRFVGYIQERTAGSVGELGWNNVGGETELGGYVILNGNATYSGSVPVPTQANPSLGPRLVVEEREVYLVDRPSLALPQTIAGLRTVYIDTVALPGAVSGQ